MGLCYLQTWIDLTLITGKLNSTLITNRFQPVFIG
jgi:hypothetical protein